DQIACVRKEKSMSLCPSSSLSVPADAIVFATKPAPPWSSPRSQRRHRHHHGLLLRVPLPPPLSPSRRLWEPEERHDREAAS
ncbi:hypothetical protein HN51_055384, partial [Arachis hypogaea]